MPSRDDFYSTVTDAINDFVERGFTSAERLQFWQRKIKEAAERTLQSTAKMEQALRDALVSVYRKHIDRGDILQFHQGVKRFTLDMVRPQLRAELDRRIMASANLIKLNREQSIAKTLQRFSGWSTSIPQGGTDIAQRAKIKEEVRKPLVSLPHEERRVLVDQGHKLISSLNDILAKDGGALAAVWEHVHQQGYDGRPEHVARDRHVFAIRGNWALGKGLMKSGKYGYTDEIEEPAFLPFCRCRYRYLYNLRSIPADMLTKKGEIALADAREKLNAA